MAASSDRWDGSEYRANASFVYSSAYTAPVLSLLGAEPSWTVLDLGCGTGELTVELARRCTSVLAVDASPAMIESARRDLPKDLAGRLSYEIADGQALPATIDPQLHGTFDAVFSSAAIHWMKSDPPAVVKGVATMLKPGGRFAAECGGALNCGSSPDASSALTPQSASARRYIKRFCAVASTRLPSIPGSSRRRLTIALSSKAQASAWTASVRTRSRCLTDLGRACAASQPARYRTRWLAPHVRRRVPRGRAGGRATSGRGRGRRGDARRLLRRQRAMGAFRCGDGTDPAVDDVHATALARHVAVRWRLVTVHNDAWVPATRNRV